MGTANELARFLDPQRFQYEEALAEMRRGRKTGHWIWFIFPQMKGLGHSPMANYYGVSGLEEARAYLEDAVLGARLREVTAAVLSHPSADIEEVMGGGLDATKLRSSMTLFDAASPDDIFAQVLDTFYGGQRDPMTLDLLKGE